MKFASALIEGRLVRRYKRFLADVELADGSVITVHCPNPGTMLGLADPGNPVWISDSENPKRKLRHTLELMKVPGALVGINTNLPNRLAEEALAAGRIPQLAGFTQLKREVPYGRNSRIDLLATGEGIADTYIEVKNVHMLREPEHFEFPDCVTARGAKHLRELADMAQAGHRAVMLFVIQRADGDRFSLARDIDPGYGAAFDEAVRAGVEALAIRCKVSTEEIVAEDLVPITEAVFESNPGQNEKKASL